MRDHVIGWFRAHVSHIALCNHRLDLSAGIAPPRLIWTQPYAGCMKLNDLIALLRRAGARSPVSGPEKAWIIPSTAVSTLADLLEGPLLTPADYKEVDVLNVDTALLHGMFTQAELKDILARMKASGKAR